jgi:uncharacterized RDD family membrane protein YckC
MNPKGYLRITVANGHQQRQTALPTGLPSRLVRFEARQTYHPLRLNDFTEASLILSNMSSAQLEIHPLDEAAAETEAAAPFALKEQVAERLAAHRARRTQHSGSPVTPIAPPKPTKARSARVAAAVAERYAQSQSYRDFLAAEAERAIREAEAVAEMAAISAQAVAVAQYELLAELDQWSLTPPEPLEAEPAAAAPTVQLSAPEAAASAIPHSAATPLQPANGGLTVRLYEEVTRHAAERVVTSRHLQPQYSVDEGLALDEEIAFRQSPVFEEPSGPAVDIPANLIEFPRQLVATRKARPRLAEGPLREDADEGPQVAQLRIFEVEASQISTEPVVESAEPEWSSILLGALPASRLIESSEPVFHPMLPPQTAPLSLRLMAGVVDGCILVASLLVFAGVSALTVGQLSHSPSTGLAAAAVVAPMDVQTAAISAGMVFCVLALMYHLLFFTLSEATPGMRYARIGLCTFNDENPSRAAMRRRLFAMALSACPIGIGFLWACLDDDKLGWHDRISRMYQRSY